MPRLSYLIQQVHRLQQQAHDLSLLECFKRQLVRLTLLRDISTSRVASRTSYRCSWTYRCLQWLGVCKRSPFQITSQSRSSPVKTKVSQERARRSSASLASCSQVRLRHAVRRVCLVSSDSMSSRNYDKRVIACMLVTHCAWRGC